MKTAILYLIFFFTMMGLTLSAQGIQNNKELTFNEYLAQVKKFHPVAQQAGIKLSAAEAELLKARGAFDPKIEIDYDRKEFKSTEYYDILNSTFKIPTWYGVELKANFEQNHGAFLNPERTVPPEGLFAAGVSIDVGRGLIINERMASLQTAKIYINQSLAERDLMVNELLYKASLAYFDWLRVYNEMKIYEGFLDNANERFVGIQQNALLGEIPAIDTVEAKIAVQNRMLELEQARVELMRARLDLSNFLWLENNIPIELQPDIIPDTDVLSKVDEALDLPTLISLPGVPEDHPKLRFLQLDINALEINQRLSNNRLLPELTLEYNFLTPDAQELQSFTQNNYKAGLRFRFPLFLRKERGEARLAGFRVQDATLDLEFNQQELENRILATINEQESYVLQNQMALEMVESYEVMLQAEERKMQFGESSLFLINTREVKLIESRLKQNAIFNKLLYTKAKLFRNLGILPNSD